jgi:hypothetical protein
MQLTERHMRAMLFTASNDYRTNTWLRVYQQSLKIKIHSTKNIPVILYGWREHIRAPGPENI